MSCTRKKITEGRPTPIIVKLSPMRLHATSPLRGQSPRQVCKPISRSKTMRSPSSKRQVLRVSSPNSGASPLTSIPRFNNKIPTGNTRARRPVSKKTKKCLSPVYSEYLAPEGVKLSSRTHTEAGSTQDSANYELDSESGSFQCFPHSLPFYNTFYGSSGQWKPKEVLGQGGEGQVIRAVSVVTGEEFAVKRLFLQSEENLDSLASEIMILKDLRHPNVVSYLGSELLGTEWLIYLEYMPGGSVRSQLNSGPLPESTVKHYVKDMLSGLSYLHSNGVVHRDLKGANLLLSASGTLKLSDFGCSRKYLFEEQSGLLKTMRGSLAWTAPEIILQTGSGRTADIWSVGCVVLEMPTAQIPWGDFEFLEILMKLANTSEIPQVPDWLSTDARAFIASCLQRDPRARPCLQDLARHPFLK